MNTHYGRDEGIRLARLRALGRSRSQRSTGALLCAARPSNPFQKEKHDKLLTKLAVIWSE